MLEEIFSDLVCDVFIFISLTIFRIGVASILFLYKTTVNQMNKKISFEPTPKLQRLKLLILPPLEFK